MGIIFGIISDIKSDIKSVRIENKGCDEMDRKYVLMLSEREMHDMTAILIMAATKLPSDSELTLEQRKILSSIDGIAKQLDDLRE